MNRALTVAASILLVWAFVPAAVAHDDSTHSGHSTAGKGAQGANQNNAPASEQDELQTLTALLNLTSAQQAKVDKFLKKQDTQIQAVQGNGNLTPNEKQTQITSIRTTTMNDIKGILTPAQLAILKKSGTGANGGGGTANGNGGSNESANGDGGNGGGDNNPPNGGGDNNP